MPIELDARGLKCPLPVLRARKVLKSVAPGEVLMVFATDQAAPKDFAVFCEQTGNRLVSCKEQQTEFVISIERVG